MYRLPHCAACMWTATVNSACVWSVYSPKGELTSDFTPIWLQLGHRQCVIFTEAFGWPRWHQVGGVCVQVLIGGEVAVWEGKEGVDVWTCVRWWKRATGDMTLLWLEMHIQCNLRSRHNYSFLFCYLSFSQSLLLSLTLIQAFKGAKVGVCVWWLYSQCCVLALVLEVR